MRANKPKANYAGTPDKVNQMDVCQTPPHALEPLYPYIPKDWIVWESACGPERLLQNTMEAQGYSVFGTDLLHGAQYNRFTYTPLLYDIEVTNMPFSIKYKWLKQAFQDNKPFALLAPYETTFAKDFQILFKEYNARPYFIEILSPERRINFKMPNMGWGITVWDEIKQMFVKKGDSAQMPTCWITWGLNISQRRTDYLRTFYVPMRAVKYDEFNKEIHK